MNRVRIALAVVAALIVLGPASAALAQSEEADPNLPPVVVEESVPGEEPEAWTFRYLIPTVIGISVVVVVFTSAVYGFRLRGRYRVAS